MANPSYQSYTTTGAKTPVVMDHLTCPFNATVAAYLVSGGTATFTVEYCLDDLNDASITARWIADANATSVSATKVLNYNNPVRAVRLNIAAISGTIEFKVLQGMSIN